MAWRLTLTHVLKSSSSKQTSCPRRHTVLTSSMTVSFPRSRLKTKSKELNECQNLKRRANNWCCFKTATSRWRAKVTPTSFCDDQSVKGKRRGHSFNNFLFQERHLYFVRIVWMIVFVKIVWMILFWKDRKELQGNRVLHASFMSTELTSRKYS